MEGVALLVNCSAIALLRNKPRLPRSTQRLPGVILILRMSFTRPSTTLAVIEALGMRLVVLYMYCVESGEEWPDITADSLWETPSTRPPGNIALKSGQEKEVHVERKGRDGGGRGGGGGGQVALERQQQQEQRQREEDKALREREREEQQRQLEEQRRKKEEEEERLVTLV